MKLYSVIWSSSYINLDDGDLSLDHGVFGAAESLDEAKVGMEEAIKEQLDMIKEEIEEYELEDVDIDVERVNELETNISYYFDNNPCNIKITIVGIEA